MLDQLERLIAVSLMPRVRLGIVPQSAQLPFAPQHGFWIFDERAVHVETVAAELTLTLPEEVGQYAPAVRVVQWLRPVWTPGPTAHREHHGGRWRMLEIPDLLQAFAVLKQLRATFFAAPCDGSYRRSIASPTDGPDRSPPTASTVRDGLLEKGAEHHMDTSACLGAAFRDGWSRVSGYGRWTTPDGWRTCANPTGHCLQARTIDGGVLVEFRESMRGARRDLGPVDGVPAIGWTGSKGATTCPCCRIIASMRVFVEIQTQRLETTAANWLWFVEGVRNQGVFDDFLEYMPRQRHDLWAPERALIPGADDPLADLPLRPLGAQAGTPSPYGLEKRSSGGLPLVGR